MENQGGEHHRRGQERRIDAAEAAKVIAETAADLATKVAEANAKTETAFALLTKDIGFIKEGMAGIMQKLDNTYVTKDQFEPVKKIVYGLTAIMLTSLVVAIVALVLRTR